MYVSAPRPELACRNLSLSFQKTLELTMSSSQSPHTLTYGMPGFEKDARFTASVVAVNPTATTLAMKCSNPDSQHCHDEIITATFGPWAQGSPPSSASTGTFDFSVGGDVPKKWHSSVHCDLVSTTVPRVCTLSFNEDYHVTHSGTTSTHTGTQYTALTSPATDYWAVETVSIVVTDGFEKFRATTSLSSVTPSSTALPHASATHVSSLQSASVTPSSGPGPSITTSTLSASSQSGAATTTLDIGVGTVGLFVLLAAFLTR
ncbi:hypothetical protein K461DRAFT_176379 [Myriangium duriaei CBS 260.36]|uniref:Uncharacterized protein n=1 Tax=Myriangium duriaei CBS 260.36 TaxID=1168546 RepID=A0A9P4MK47_9PEZI|nr:hypothetical protein K461DRAFT_176379 [Myriangium duriaei CBS 260.36]